jgi:hypothetical protein
MKKIVILSILVSTLLLSDSTGRFEIVGNSHSKKSREEINVNKQHRLQDKDRYLKNIKDITDFMDSVKSLSAKQRREAELFKVYVQTHISSVASCKNMEEEFQLDRNNGISNEEVEMYVAEIADCKKDLRKSMVTYQGATDFFNEAEQTLKTLKMKNRFAQKRYNRLKTQLEEINAFLEYVNEVE